ncbi:MAG: S41 family peptidase [Gammaproteobacteria bacterium]|nr:S41 family peptidase [Gammaproteobacteria bacterium]
MNKTKRVSFVSAVPAVLVAMLAGCSSGGGGGNSASPPIAAAVPATDTGSSGSSSGNTFMSGVFQPFSNFDALCATPRTGTDPSTGASFSDSQGTFVDENNWLRSWSNELYLWYDEIVDIDPQDETTPDYFDLMKTFATTPSGAPVDKFHFTIPTDDFQALSQSGISAGYGAVFAILASSPPRSVVVAYTEPDSPAASDPANLLRGASILNVDGADLVNGNSSADIDTLNAGLFPADVGETHQFTVLDLGSVEPREVTLTSALITSDPVQNVGTITTNTGEVAYMSFNDHIATAEQELIDAIVQLNSSGITDLVLDLRYNGGGFLDIANELAFMIAGPAAASGRTFEELQFNDKHPVFDPVTGATLSPIVFHTTSVGFSATANEPLPSLDLSRVFILTGPGTCSASESIINGLRGIDVEVIQVGSTTCGKPYGFYAFDNCGTTYFSIQFRGVNAKDFGDYTDGFSPDNVVQVEGTQVPGCSVADDFTHQLGDREEARLAAALAYRVDGSCPAASGFTASRAAVSLAPLSAVDGVVPKPIWLQNRILRR